MNITFRSITPEDGPALLAIEAQSFHDPHWSLDDLVRDEGLAAEADARIVGFLIARELVPETNGQPAEREILNLAVIPEFRRQGIATALLAIECAGHATHFLEVRESNAAAQQLYARFDFREVGRRPSYYVSPVETAIVMRRK